MPTANPVLIAYKEGNWLRNPKKLIIEITSEAENITKLDITAILSEKKSSRHLEEVIEENLVAKLNNIFKKSNKKTIWDLTR